MKAWSMSMATELRERGAAAVEFALVAMMLIVLVFGILEGGRLWMIQGSLSQAAREWAREVAIKGSEASGDVVTSRTEHLGLESVGFTAAADCMPGDNVEVTVTADVKSMTGLLDVALPLFGGNESMKLTGKAEMRCGG